MGKRGACVQVTHDGVIHEGIDCGDGTVIHLDDVKSKEGALIVRCSEREFAGGLKVKVVKYDQHDDPKVIVERAASRVGPNRDFLSCVHFVHWCMKGAVSTRADYRERTVDELIAQFNSEVGNEGWGYSRSVSLSLLREALLATTLDCSAFIDQQGMSLRQRIGREGERFVLVPSST